jgi:ABC-type Fe3+/spermidine/putrescine transport system ATPase subunit
VAMGRAIVRRPQAFLMDEPLSNLDAKLRGPDAGRDTLYNINPASSLSTSRMTRPRR